MKFESSKNIIFNTKTHELITGGDRIFNRTFLSLNFPENNRDGFSFHLITNKWHIILTYFLVYKQ